MNTINLGTTFAVTLHQLQFKFLRARNFLPVNFQQFANIMISATDSYLSYKSTRSLITTSLGLVKMRDPCTRCIF